ncbi:hypothetical protein RIF29_30372 [Crotalaria pallida]|uniref:Uncharacterized protein n=1 Tax=Crotalaria pallida TaxID=3830 RepID=A0AAN9I175_CROPI
MLLQPRNSMESYCQNLKLNIDETEKMKYFICENWECSRIGDFNAVKEVTVNITKSTMVDLLKCSMVSKTPLTDLFLRKKLLVENSQWRDTLDFNIVEPEANVETGKMIVKLMIRKSNSKILFALAEEGFVDFLFSFLTFPLGTVVEILKGNSGLSGVDNLYNSMVDFDDYRYFTSPELKEKLRKPRISHQFKLRKQIVQIEEELASNYSCYSYRSKDIFVGSLSKQLIGYYSIVYKTTTDVYAPLSYLEPQSSTGDIYDSCGGRGFSKCPSLYMVTDDLVVTPNSPLSAISLFSKLKISPSDLEERVISIGQKEYSSWLLVSFDMVETMSLFKMVYLVLIR